MVNYSDSEEGSDSERMMNENLPPEGLIECDNGGDTLMSCEISNKFHGRLYACGVTGIHVNETSQMSCRDGQRDTRTASFLTKQVWVTYVFNNYNTSRLSEFFWALNLQTSSRPLGENSICAVIVAWLNASRRSRVGVGINSSGSGEVMSVLSGPADGIPRYIRTYLAFKGVPYFQK